MEENPQQPPNPHMQSEASTNPPLPQKSSNKLVPILLVIIIVLLGAGIYFYLTLKKIPTVPQAQKITSPSITTTPSQKVEERVELSGKIKELSQDLELITRSDPNTSTPSTYYEAGTYVNGQFKGYKRYLAISGNPSQGFEPTYIFASNDNKKYILDADPIDIKTRTTKDYDPLYEINKNKITKIAPLDTSHPQNIQLDSRFALNRNILLTKLFETGNKDQNGNPESKFILNTDFSSYIPIKSQDSKLTFYTGKKPEQYHDPKITPTPNPEDQFIDGTTGVIAVDSTGLAYSYDLTNPKHASEYPQKMLEFNKAIASMSKSSKADYPTYPSRPNLRLTKSDIQTNSTLYDKYDVALPGGCAFDVNTLVINNLSEHDLQKIGTSSYGDIFILSDKNHQLIKAEYDKKLGIYNDPGNADLYAQVNKGTKPTFDNYVSKNPLIFFKDYWGRWVALGEYDINLPGGCGKPVVYLYPAKPTKVSVKFTTPIRFDVSIPQYQNGWNVLAQPNGTLTDLQPQFTNCNLIDDSKSGSEYAKNACLNNSYPYLYWAGQSTEKQYPQVDKGWIVESRNLSGFLNQKLDEVKFTKKEKNDFLEYWLPELQSKNANYYRISFLQTQDMNSIAPMQIIPQPKNVYRIFMDYSTYTYKPSPIQPQTLSKVVRDGFTVVEWGGLKGVLLR
ncbi:MAG TPA: hypothetical protein VLG67_02940 [Candidatus Saccharimonadales bacterium]|nr:hypothetical protein [Candidatus Saccharimonadales bacterium]